MSSAEFWAGYLSGAAGIIVGNPLDVAKVRLQARHRGSGGSDDLAGSGSRRRQQRPASGLRPRRQQHPASGLTPRLRALAAGAAAPVLSYGALNALLFLSYRRSEAALDRALSTTTTPADRSLWVTWLAGALGGLCTWLVSAPTELVKCRAQLSMPTRSSWAVARSVWRCHGLRGFYLGGCVTALRDSIGYGFYFWSYDLAAARWPSTLPSLQPSSSPPPTSSDTKALLCGGLAGIVTWASVFPLDVVKTRLQAQPPGRPHGALHIARAAFREGGLHAFFRGLAVCSIRAFVVNAVQWAVYERVLRHMAASES